ncbi:MAG: helix-turn-helix transcriptional regulator [Verrucomicrobiota bacterium]|nr:helix-turn-helix transcriptional regulator [Verrucomicrobiota bacterium]
MNPPVSERLWPERALRRHPIERVFACGRQLHPPLYSHVVNFPRLELPLRGCYENQIESGGRIITVRLRPGAALFAAPNCWNLPVWRPGLELMSLLFGAKQIGVSIVTARRRQGPQLAARKFSLPRPVTGPVPPLLEAMVQLPPGNGASEIFPELARALLQCVRHLLQQPPLPTPAGRAHALLESVCVFLQNHYQYDITRNSVAEQFGVTPNHLSRLFQMQGHMTFSNYLTHVRIDRAKHLLWQYNLKLDEIALRCGYHDTPYFCHVFKRLTKSTPAEYRVKARALRAGLEAPPANHS